MFVFCVTIFSCSKQETPEKKDRPIPLLEGDIIAFTDNSQITSFAKDGYKLWVGYSGELRCYDLDKKILLKRYKFGKEIFLSHIYQIKAMRGKLWIATSIGLFSFDDKTDRWEAFLCGRDLPLGGVEVMDVDPEGKGLWLGVRKSMYLGEGGDIRLGYFDTGSGAFQGIKIGSDYVKRLFVTRENLWFLTRYFGEGGDRLIKFGRKKLVDALARKVENEKEITEGKEEYSYSIPTYIEDIAPQYDGVAVLFKIISTDREGQPRYELKFIKENGESTPFSYPKGINLFIPADDNESIWVYDDKRIYYYKDKKWKDLPLRDSIKIGKFIGLIDHGGEKYLIVKSLKKREQINGLYDFSGKRVLNFSEPHELSEGENFVISLRDSDENLWIIAKLEGFPTEINRFNEKSNTWEYIDNRKFGIQPSDKWRVNREVVFIWNHLGRVKLWVYFENRHEKTKGLKPFIYDPIDHTIKEEVALTLKFEASYIDSGRLRGIHRPAATRETEKNIWLMTGGGSVIFYDRDKKCWQVYPQNFSGLAAFEKYGIWSAMGSAKILYMDFLRFDDKKLFSYFIETSKINIEENEPDAISAMAIDGKVIWLGIGRILAKLNTETKEIEYSYSLSEIERTGEIDFIQPYLDKYLIIGVNRTNGDDVIEHWLWVFDKETGKSFNTNLSRHIRGISLINLLLDEYALWVGAREGVFRIDQKFLMKLIEASAKE
jgi:hypothetical protein